MERTPLQEAVNGWLAEGPLSVDELADRAEKAGLVAAETDDEAVGPLDAIDDLLERSDGYWPMHSDNDDGLVVLASTFVDTGMSLTHRVTEKELEAEAIELTPDLSVLDWDRHEGLALDDGSGSVAAHYLGPGISQLSGPAGWCETFQPGSLLVFTRTEGVLSVKIIEEEELSDGAAEIEALGDAAARWIVGGQGQEELPFVMETMARNPTLFRRPVPPVGELLVAAGMEQRGIEWGWVGQQWQTRHERFKDHDHAIRRLYGFEHCCDQAFDRVEEVFFDHVRKEVVDGRELARHLAHGSVAAAFVHAHASMAPALVGFAAAAADSLKGRNGAPALTMLGMARLRAGEAEGALEALDAAVHADPDLPAAAGALALLELDRGNLSRAHTLAVRDGIDTALIEWIEHERIRQSALRPAAGRNDPCPCGSGKKFKRCCVSGGPLPLAQRVPLILLRMAHYATGPEGHNITFGLALSASARHDDVGDAIRRFLKDVFMVDVAVHEGGLGEEYVEERGPLLAADEITLLDAVLEEPRRLWEIMAVTPGASLTLRDTGSGEEVRVIERLGSEGRQPGELLLARVTTVEGEPMLFGVLLLVPLRERARVLRMLDGSVDGWVDADSLAMWFGSLFLPPRMANREGEKLVLRETVCDVAEGDETVVAALDETYERQGDDHVWHEITVVDEHDQIVRGVLRLDGLRLSVESNSEERQERLLATLDELFDYVITDDGEIEEADLDDQDRDGFGPLDSGDMSDELSALVEQHIIEYEQRWIDESIPALDGLTPRQALDDPTRREDLFALLREMRSSGAPEGEIAMSVDRIEQLLGVEPG